MKIVELFRRLSFGELSNLAISNNDGSLVEEKHPQIIQYVNEGLLRLHSRFSLYEKSLILEQYAHIVNYHLIRKYAETSGSNTHHPYIKDLPDDPFLEDVIMIIAVHDEFGQSLPLNDRAHPYSLFTPQPNILMVPNPQERRPLSVSYQARHRLLDDREGHILDQEIDLPFALEGALQSFVAGKTYSHMNGQENIVKSQENMAAYEAICLEIQDRDLVNETNYTSHFKLEIRGFV